MKKILGFHYLFVFLFFVILSGAITYPLLFHLSNFATGLGDELLIAWIMNWVMHAMSNPSVSFFDANIYYPFANSLAFSDLFITSSLIAFFPLLFLQEPIVANNITLISSLALLGFSVYVASYYVTKNIIISLFSGLLILFSPAVLDKTTHLQILAIQWVPLAIVFFLQFVESLKRKYLVISLFFFILQTYNSFLPGYFILFFYSITLFFTWVYQRKKIKKIMVWKNVLLFFLSILILLPIILPYYRVSHEFHYTRDIRDAIHFALQPEDLLYSSPHSRLAPILNTLPFNISSQNDEFKPGYVGFIFTFLSLFTFFYWIKKKQKKETLTIFITTAITALVISFGPVLHLFRQTVHIPFPVPLPYMLFYYFVPGFQGFRNSARWEMLFILCMAISIAIVLKQVLKKVSIKKQIIFFLFLFLGIIAEFNFPMSFVKVPKISNFPSVYFWLETTPKDTKIIELPIYNWNMTPYVAEEMKREYYSTIHFRKMINGYSGFSPPPWQVLVTTLLKDFPSEKTINLLKKMDIDYVIIHAEEYDQLSADNFFVEQKKLQNWETIKKQIDASNQFHLIKQFGKTFVYLIN